MPPKQTAHPLPDPGPRPTEARRAAWLWVGALALAVLLLGADTKRRVDAIARATETRIGAGVQPEVDPGSPSGYRWDQHRLLLTQTDGYQWLLQAEQAIERGELRVRETARDNAPSGREVHWAGPMRWWSQGLARLYRLSAPELTPPQALERVAPWANAALLGVLLIALTPLLAIRLGAIPAALFALGGVAVSPLYDLFAAGYLDHHGLAAMCCVVAVLFMLCGGAGWIRDGQESGRPRPDDRGFLDWLPTRRDARIWFACSGLTSAAGVWVSAATTVPVLIGLGIGALVCARMPVGSVSTPPLWVLEPKLFRVWGAAAAACSFCLYLLEYFPADLSMRLEVNHPLYSLALLGAGDLLARATARPSAGSRSAAGWLVADLAMVLSLPVVILLTGETTFRIADPFLWVIHDRYITEFLDLRSWMLTRPPATVAAEMSLAPLVALPLAALLWRTPLEGGWRAGWRAWLILLVAGGGSYAYIFFLGLAGGGGAMAVIGAAAALGLWFLWPTFHGARELPSPARSVVVLAALPALLTLLLALFQMRWLGVAAALALAAMVAVTSVLLALRHPFVREANGRVAAAALVLGVVAVPPMFASQRPVTPANTDAIVRDASSWLRTRLGERRGIVLAGPTVTSQMIWFGGFDGVGTLYWENLEGLRASAETYGAPDQDSAHALVTRRGITHLAFFGWDGGLEQLLFSDGRAREGVGPEEAGAVLHRVELEMRQDRWVDLPPWLLPLPYAPPRVAGYHHPIARLLEVVDAMPPEVALVRLARYYQAFDDPRMDEALARSFEIGVSVPGLAMLAQQQWARGGRPAFLTTVERLRAQLDETTALELEDRLEVAITLGLTGNREEISRHLGIVLAEADEAQLRRLREERLSLLVAMSQELGLDRAYPEAAALASSLVPRR